MVKVSVIIPVYNVEAYLRQCLDSVIGQTMKEIEIICVNDSSTDSSLGILEEYAQKDSRIQVITQSNAGAGAARNRGMLAATGRYLCFLDSDDFFEPTLLEKEYKLAEKDQADFVVCKSDQFHTDKKEFVPVNWVVREKEIPPYHPFSHRQMTGNVFKVFVGWAWDKLYRREFVDRYQLKFQEQRTSNDMLFVFSGVALAKRISVVPEVLVHQRRDAKDSLSKTRENSWQCFYQALLALRERLRTEGLYGELEKDFINYALHFTLWNYNTLSEPTRTMLRDKLKEEWLQELGIKGKGSDYFYVKKEYQQYRELFCGAGDTEGMPEKTGGADGLSGKSEEAEYDQRPENDQKDKNGQKTGNGPADQEKQKAGSTSAGSKEGGQVGVTANREYVGTMARIKRKLRHFVPVGHAYLDRAFASYEKKNNKFVKEQMERLQKKQTEELHKQVNQLLSEIKCSNKEQVKAAADVKKYVEQEFHRRDDWEKREAETARLAAGRQVWVIKCPAPEDASRIRWGDYPFALTLKRYLERLNIYVVVDTREDWGCEAAGADVVIALRGCAFYRPDRRNKKCLYIMWNISHPDMVTEDEYQLYDVICVGSRHYAEELRKKLTIPVLPLLQCTDTEVFYPTEVSAEEYKQDYIFVGNSRGVARNCVMWAIEDRLSLRMWGSGWNTILRDHMDLIAAPFIENSQIPELYRTSRVALNDHWKDMLDKQFINNRIFDALACGLPVISDTCEELKEIFPEAVLHYETRADFDECVQKIQNDYPAVKKKVMEQWELIKQEYSFEARARELVEIVREYKND